MKLLFLNKTLSKLSESDPRALCAIRESLLLKDNIEEVNSPEWADAIIIQEKNSFKNFRYIKELQTDAIISAFPEKVFTINSDDCATGLLRGLYTSLPKTRFNSSKYVSVPYMDFPNDLVFDNYTDKTEPIVLASWRGNIKSNALRSSMVNLLGEKEGFSIQKSYSWLNHNLDEKRSYTELIRSSKFSLCPAGWAPVSFRIYESMALGRCPVIIADNFVPPNGPDWKKFALFFPENNLKELPSFLLRHEHQAEQLGLNAFAAWHKYFSADVIKDYYAAALLSLIISTPKVSKKAEFKRWDSLNLHWDNKWTFPQRIINKCFQMQKKYKF